MARPTDPREPGHHPGREPGRDAVQQAALWHVRLADDECDDAGREAFRAWLDADASHRIAYDRIAAVAGRVSAQGPVGATALSTLLSRRYRRDIGTAALLFGTIAAAGWIAADDPALRSRIAGHRTTTALATGTTAAGDRVTLDGDSAADIDAAGRAVRLWRGGVMANVRSGLAQPFVVRTPEGTARALGTRFGVRREDGATLVTVIESRVEACPARRGRACLTLETGQSARLDRTGVHRAGDVAPDAAAAWSEGLLVADDMSLADVLARLNRYRAVPIRYDAARLAGLRVSGTFPATDAGRALASIAQVLPVTIAHDPHGIVVRRRGN